MGRSIETPSAVRLWNHQKKAINEVLRYLTAYRRHQTMGSALVHMPTGSGKTGVMAVLARYAPQVGSVLVLSPRIGLRDQLRRDIEARFFTNFGLDPRSLPKKVVLLGDAPIRSWDRDGSDQSVFIGTIQKLHSLARRADPFFRVLQDHVDLLMVDEGHYEPAPEWRNAIRALSVPKVIFTATPYRNDLKLFDIDYRFGFSYTFGEALKERYIRRVQVHSRQQTSSPKAFIRDVVSFYDQNLEPTKRPPEKHPRVIIRCDATDSIRQIAAELENAGKTYVAIHERFSDNDPARPNERKHVPDPASVNAIFWVHQFKLLEGIDDRRFQLLAMYQELKNARQLVQQVGRVIRNPDRSQGSVAFVLDHTNGRQKSLWDGYVAYEEFLAQEGTEALDIGSRLYAQWQAAESSPIYLDGKFRGPFELSALDVNDELQLPLTVNVFRRLADFRLQVFLTALEQQYRDQDRKYKLFELGEGGTAIVYVSFRSSPLLKTSYFMEPKLGVTIVRAVGEHVCHFDSNGLTPYGLPGVGRPADGKELRRLFRRDKTTRLTAVGLANSNLSARSIRTRAISAASIGDSAPSLDDHAFACTTAVGYTPEIRLDDPQKQMRVRRYVGFQRGRITDAASGRASLSEYMTWLDLITAAMTSKRAEIPVLSRYAAQTDAPANPKPVNVLLDLAEVQNQYLTTSFGRTQSGRALSIRDVCADVANGRFTVTANGMRCDATIEFRDSRYRIDSADLDALYASSDPNEPEGIVTYLNRTQSFRVIPQSPGVFYTLGAFFRPRLDLRFVADLLEPIPVLGTLGSEKGTRARPHGAGWDRNSLFGLIDSLGRGTGLRTVFGNPDFLICDDMQTEACDFLLADMNPNRVALIHAKAESPRAIYSASRLQEVCGQATKNLIYLSRFSNYVPTKAHLWHSQPWRSNHVQGSVRTRMRRGSGNGLQVWSQIQQIMRDNNSTIEVWLMLGQLLSASGFRTALASNTAEALQAAFLLFSTLTDVASQGARLRVFCSP